MARKPSKKRGVYAGYSKRELEGMLDVALDAAGRNLTYALENKPKVGKDHEAYQVLMLSVKAYRKQAAEYAARAADIRAELRKREKTKKK